MSEGNQRKHDATFFRDGVYFQRPRWWWRSEPPKAWAEWKRWGIGLVCVALGYGLLNHRTGTEWLLVLILGPAAGVYMTVCFRRLQEWGHDRTVVRPLAYRL